MDFLLNFTRVSYTLCYKNIYGDSWNCEYGYDSIIDIDDRSRELRKLNSKYLATIFFSFRNLVPVFMQKYYISNQLKPRIHMKKCYKTKDYE